MTRFKYFGGGSVLAIALTFGAPAFAQNVDTDTADTTTEVEEVIVTGSYIRGTPEDAALPVDVIGQEELEKQGSPTTVELMKALPVSNGVLGDTNQFDSRAQGSEGSGSVNLRGLGPQRTLVLLNGQRLAINPFALAGAGAVDTNTIPVAAIGRVEVLKEGAAATYGSDAMGGVVNFITRRGFDGVELGASYRWIDGSDGDYTAHANFGKDWDRADVFVSLGWSHRSELSVAEREWANLPYEDNPEGGWSAAGNPSSFIPLASTGNRFRDTQCETLGGFAGYSGVPGAAPLGVTPVCYWHYTPYDNLVEEEDRYQAYAEFNYQVTDATEAHVDFMWSSTDVPQWKTSPSYALLGTPTANVGSIANNYAVPATNPGLLAYIAANPTIPATNSTTAAPVTLPGSVLAFGALVIATRPYAIGGNPMFDYGASEGKREFDAWRISGKLSGQVSESTNWDINVTYGRQTGVRTGYDTVVNRYQLALRGYGSLQSDIDAGDAGCSAAETANWTTGAGNAALGCYWFNPFSSAVPSNVFTGQTTPQHTAALENSPDLTRWFFQELWTEQTAQVLTAEAILNGELGFTLPGGPVGWAAGVQHRQDFFEADYNNISNRDLNPCVDTPTHGNMTCANPNGPFAFLGVGSPTDLKRTVWSTFGELSLPVTDAIQVQLAVRYEHYGSQTGSTFDPKLAVRWQITDMFALRGSVGSTFRAPPVVSLSDNFVTSLQSIAGIFRAVDIFGNPDLEPETAKTYSVGFIADVGGFRGTLDYWSFDFDNPITTDPVAGIVNAIFPNGQTGANNCTDPAMAALVARFTFTGGVCNPTQIQRLRTNTVNGAAVKTSGWDLLADYDFGDLGFAELSAGASLTYVAEYETAATTVEGVVVAPAFDAVGLLNYQTTAYPLPQWKGEFHVELTRDIHNLRWTTRYLDSYVDQRTAPFTTTYRGDVYATDTFTVAEGKEIDSFLTSDLTYRGQLPMDTTLVLSVENIFDQEPSFARLDLNYDPFTGDPLGRNFKVAVTKRF